MSNIKFHWSASRLHDVGDEEEMPIPVEVWAKMSENAKASVLDEWLGEHVTVWAEPE